jgi:hypothetical protein
MATTIDLPEQLSQQLKELTARSDEGDAVLTALQEYVRFRRRMDLIAASGTIDFDLDWDYFQSLEHSGPNE